MLEDQAMGKGCVIDKFRDFKPQISPLPRNDSALLIFFQGPPLCHCLHFRSFTLPFSTQEVDHLRQIQLETKEFVDNLLLLCLPIHSPRRNNEICLSLNNNDTVIDSPQGPGNLYPRPVRKLEDKGEF